ncbi:MAG TPA: HAD-IA family hydrolase [Candidatus Faecaligallichristensenella faecipullorum]|nr:HAD-IA family hydrolase [Candidatus Faecaligallichristensenella faecipullorum]
MKYEAILFDLDGTLLNTLEDLKDSCNAALEACGYAPRTLDEVRRFVGNGVGLLIRRALPEGVGEEEWARCLALFKAHYQNNLDNKTRPYPGIEQALDALLARGYRIGVVSNKFDAAVKALCAHHFPRIQVAVGEREGVRKKPAPDSALAAAQALGVQPASTLYVGDSEVDIQTARNAGMDCLSVDWGFRPEAVLREAGATRIIHSPGALLDAIEK